MNKIIVLLLFVLALWACQGNSKITDMPSSVEMNLIKSVQIPENCAHDCLISDSILVLINDCGKELFSLYNVNGGCTHIVDFGMKGSSPGEFIMPLFVNDIDYSSGMIPIYDPVKYKLYSLDLPKVMANENIYSLVREHEEDTPNMLSNSVDLSYAGRDIIAGNEISKDPASKIFFIYSAKDDRKNAIDFKPAYTFKDNAVRLVAYSNSIFANKNRGVISVAFKHLDMVNFYDVNGRILKSVRFSKIVNPQNLEDPISIADRPIFHSLSYGTTDYLYVRRPEASISDLMQGNVREIKILKFDWDGNLIAVYKTGKNIQAFCVDERTNILYAITKTSNPEYAEIVMFNINL